MIWWLVLAYLTALISLGYIAQRLWSLDWDLSEKKRAIFFAPTICPIFEEGLFRWLPLVLGGPLGVIIGTIVWILVHEPKKYLPIAVSGAFYCYLWIIEYGWLAITLHYAVNAGCVIYALYRDKELRKAVLATIRS